MVEAGIFRKDTFVAVDNSQKALKRMRACGVGGGATPRAPGCVAQARGWRVVGRRCVTRYMGPRLSPASQDAYPELQFKEMNVLALDFEDDRFDMVVEQATLLYFQVRRMVFARATVTPCAWGVALRQEKRAEHEHSDGPEGPGSSSRVVSWGRRGRTALRWRCEGTEDVRYGGGVRKEMVWYWQRVELMLPHRRMRRAGDWRTEERPSHGFRGPHGVTGTVLQSGVNSTVPLAMDQGSP